MKTTLALLMILSATTALASGESSAPKGKLSCDETSKPSDANFSEMSVSFSGKNASIKAKLSESRIEGLQNEISQWQKVLDGTAIGGGVATDEDKAEAQKTIESVNALIKAGKSGITFKATLQPYVHQPAGGLIRYSLEPTSAGVDAATIWDRLGNEGQSGILRLNPQDLKNSVEIYVAGDQGGVYDNFSCDQE